MTPIVDSYDMIICDLDGVLYLIDRPIPEAVGAVTALRERRIPVAYATNNASRRPVEVARLLAGLGVPADPDEVLTSAEAAAMLLAQRYPAGTDILVVGGDALRTEVRKVGLVPVDTAAGGPRAVVQGYAPGVGWAQLAEACVAVRAGAEWIATNTDTTMPSPRGPLPGNGALIAAVRAALGGREPDAVVGKPAPGLLVAAARRTAASRPLVVGDRLDTDIEGAVRAGMDSLLVLSGVTSAAALLAAPEHQRPTYVAADLGGLFTVDVEARLAVAGGECAAGGWSAARRDGRIELSGSGATLHALRALCGVAWQEPRLDPGTVSVAAGTAAARAALRALGLDRG